MLYNTTTGVRKIFNTNKWTDLQCTNLGILFCNAFNTHGVILKQHSGLHFFNVTIKGVMYELIFNPTYAKDKLILKQLKNGTIKK